MRIQWSSGQNFPYGKTVFQGKSLPWYADVYFLFLFWKNAKPCSHDFTCVNNNHHFSQIPLLIGLGETYTLTGLQRSMTQGSPPAFETPGAVPFLLAKLVPKPSPLSTSVKSSAKLISMVQASVHTWWETRTVVRSLKSVSDISLVTLLPSESGSSMGRKSEHFGTINCVCWSGYFTFTRKVAVFRTLHSSASRGTPITRPAVNFSAASTSPVGSVITAVDMRTYKKTTPLWSKLHAQLL